jgi:hypothetical protein
MKNTTTKKELTMETKSVVCVMCGATSGRFCPMSRDGEGPHEFIEDVETPVFNPTPSGYLPGQDDEVAP